MEKSFYEAFKLMKLRPKKYKGTEIDYVPVVFDDNGMYEVDIEDVTALGMIPGDTVEVMGKIISDEDDSKYMYITLYLSDDVLTQFIEKYGYEKIAGKAIMKVQVCHEIIESDFFDERKKELTGYKVLALYPDIK